MTIGSCIYVYVYVVSLYNKPKRSAYLEKCGRVEGPHSWSYGQSNWFLGHKWNTKSVCTYVIQGAVHLRDDMLYMCAQLVRMRRQLLMR